MNLKHDRELWDQSESLLEKIKQDYGLFSVHMDDVASVDIRTALIDYAEYFYEKNTKKKKVAK